jgi:hypothetical protein
MTEFPDINAILLEFKRFMQIAMILDWSEGTVYCANSFHLMIKSVLYCSTFMTEQHPLSDALQSTLTNTYALILYKQITILNNTNHSQSL